MKRAGTSTRTLQCTVIVPTPYVRVKACNNGIVKQRNTLAMIMNKKAPYELIWKGHQDILLNEKETTYINIYGFFPRRKGRTFTFDCTSKNK